MLDAQLREMRVVCHAEHGCTDTGPGSGLPESSGESPGFTARRAGASLWELGRCSHRDEASVAIAACCPSSVPVA